MSADPLLSLSVADTAELLELLRDAIRVHDGAAKKSLDGFELARASLEGKRDALEWVRDQVLKLARRRPAARVDFASLVSWKDEVDQNLRVLRLAEEAGRSKRGKGRRRV